MFFILDSSGSIGDNNWPTALKFVRSLVNTLTIGPDAARIGVYAYDYRLTRALELNSYDNKPAILNAINNIPFLGDTTDTALAIYTMRTEGFTKANGDRDDALNICVVITDGDPKVPNDQLGREYTRTNATAATDADIMMFAIGIGGNINKDILKEIATDDELVFTVNDVAALANIRDSFTAVVCEIAVGK